MASCESPVFHLLFVNVHISPFCIFISEILCFIRGTTSRALTYPTLDFFFVLFFLNVRFNGVLVRKHLSATCHQTFVGSWQQWLHGFFLYMFSWVTTLALKVYDQMLSCARAAHFYHCGVTKKSEHALYTVLSFL